MCADIHPIPPRPWTPSRPHSSFEPLIQLDPDGGRSTASDGARSTLQPRKNCVPSLLSRGSTFASDATFTPLLPQCKHFSHGGGGDGRADGREVPRLPLVEKKAKKRSGREKGMRRKWSQYLSGFVKKVSRCLVFVRVARCLPFICLSDDLVARQAGNPHLSRSGRRFGLSTDSTWSLDQSPGLACVRGRA